MKKIKMAYFPKMVYSSPEDYANGIGTKQADYYTLEPFCLETVRKMPGWDDSYREIEDTARYICACDKNIREQLADHNMYPDDTPSNGDTDEWKALDFGGTPWAEWGFDSCDGNGFNDGSEECAPDNCVHKILGAPVGNMTGLDIGDCFMALGFVFYGNKDYRPVYGIMYWDEELNPNVYIPIKGNSLDGDGCAVQDFSWNNIEIYKERLGEWPTGDSSVPAPFDWAEMKKEIEDRFIPIEVAPEAAQKRLRKH